MAMQQSLNRIAVSALVFASAWAGRAAIPSAEKLFPEDTLALVSVPDFPRLCALYQASPQGQFLRDPGLKAFRDKFLSKWNEQFVEPLVRELGIRLEDYTSLPQGQVTLALSPNSESHPDQQWAAWVLLMDTKDKSTQLKTNLAAWRKKWMADGKSVQTEKILQFEFSVFTLSTNDVPATWKKYFPSPPEVQELAGDSETPKPPPARHWVVGQVDSLLLMGSSLKNVQKVVIRLAGGSSPVVGDLASFQANQPTLFRDVPLYGWVNMKALADLLLRKRAPTTGSEPSEAFAAVTLERLLPATGLAALKTVAFNIQHSNEGDLFQVFLGVPEPGRQGLFKVLTGEPKDATPPPFIPTDAVKFQRWRLDGPNAWDTIQKVLNDISPGAINAINLLIDTANERTKESDPGFDLRKYLFGNLGDDVIIYEKAPRPNAPPDSGPGLVLIGSPNAEQLAAALKSLLVFMTVQDAPANDREFLGRKIFSVPVMPIQLGPPEPGKPAAPRTLNYAAAGGYLAMSTDAAVLEEYLRNIQGQCKGLREMPGLAEAFQKVSGPCQGLLGYKNQAEIMRTIFEALRRDPAGAATNAAGLNPLSELPAISVPSQAFTGWMDFSLLPPYEHVAKYFYFNVYGASAGADGVSFRMFLSAPPQLRGGGKTD
jgi:hypothetical protein